VRPSRAAAGAVTAAAGIVSRVATARMEVWVAGEATDPERVVANWEVAAVDCMASACRREEATVRAVGWVRGAMEAMGASVAFAEAGEAAGPDS